MNPETEADCLGSTGAKAADSEGPTACGCPSVEGWEDFWVEAGAAGEVPAGAGRMVDAMRVFLEMILVWTSKDTLRRIGER